MRARIGVAVTVIQSLLFLVHLFIYETWIALAGTPREPLLSVLRIALALLSISFVSASLLAHHYFNRPVRLLYRLAGIWLGFVNFAFAAAGFAWIVVAATIVLNLP